MVKMDTVTVKSTLVDISNQIISFATQTIEKFRHVHIAGPLSPADGAYGLCHHSPDDRVFFCLWVRVVVSGCYV